MDNPVVKGFARNTDTCVILFPWPVLFNTAKDTDCNRFVLRTGRVTIFISQVTNDTGS